MVLQGLMGNKDYTTSGVLITRVEKQFALHAGCPEGRESA